MNHGGGRRRGRVMWNDGVRRVDTSALGDQKEAAPVGPARAKGIARVERQESQIAIHNINRSKCNTLGALLCVRAEGTH